MIWASRFGRCDGAEYYTGRLIRVGTWSKRRKVAMPGRALATIFCLGISSVLMIRVLGGCGRKRRHGRRFFDPIKRPHI